MFATLQQWKLVRELPMPGVMLKSCCRWWGPWRWTGDFVGSSPGPGWNFRHVFSAIGELHSLVIGILYVMAYEIIPKYMDVSENRGPPKSSILIGFSIINHPFWGTPIFGNTHIWVGGWEVLVTAPLGSTESWVAFVDRWSEGWRKRIHETWNMVCFGK